MRGATRTHCKGAAYREVCRVEANFAICHTYKDRLGNTETKSRTSLFSAAPHMTKYWFYFSHPGKGKKPEGK